jgi:hypothetical protein
MATCRLTVRFLTLYQSFNLGCSKSINKGLPLNLSNQVPVMGTYRVLPPVASHILALGHSSCAPRRRRSYGPRERRFRS